MQRSSLSRNETYNSNKKREKRIEKRKRWRDALIIRLDSIFWGRSLNASSRHGHVSLIWLLDTRQAGRQTGSAHVAENSRHSLSLILSLVVSNFSFSRKKERISRQLRSFSFAVSFICFVVLIYTPQDGYAACDISLIVGRCVSSWMDCVGLSMRTK